jgi:hypothetical protein
MMDDLTSYEDAASVGFKIVEMADRLKVANACVPGARASWAMEVDDVRYAIEMRIVPASEDASG